MIIANHKLSGVPFNASPNVGGMLDPNYVIMHYTAGWNASSAIMTFMTPASKVSAHVVVDRDGSVTQCVPFNRVAWHAGPSKYDGVVGMNNHSIGIEIVNIGFLREKPGVPGKYQMNAAKGWTDVSDRLVADLDLEHSLRAPHTRVGGGVLVWPAYTKVQIDAVKAIFAALATAYKIKDVTGHENIDTRGWKVDPGPAFPMGEFKAMLHAPLEAVTGRSATAGSIAGVRLGNFAAKQALNVRQAANSNAPILTVLKPGQEVALVNDLGDWNLVEYAPGKQGYVSEKYLQKAS